MNKLCASAIAESNVGKIRKNNEDNFLLNGEIVDSQSAAVSVLKNSNGFVCAVCDGVGGEAAGEKASKIAANTVKQSTDYLLKNRISEAAFDSVLKLANDEICEERRKSAEKMGTTIAALGFLDGNLMLANLGDSRIYKFSDGNLIQLSKDHTREQFLLNAGIRSSNPNDSHVLTQYLGINPEDMLIEPYIIKERARKSDIYLLCTDGLYDMVENEKIAEILNRKGDLQVTAHELVEAALENGGKDNVTVVLVSFGIKRLFN